MTGVRLCIICGHVAVGKCWHDVRWHLCEFHLICAGGCGFLPSFYESPRQKIMPDDAVRMWRERAELDDF